MGLDMYLSAERFVSGYDFRDDDEKNLYREMVKLTGFESVADPRTPTLTVNVTVAYWRKANAIHRWFVDNVQDGVDECQKSDVSREQLVELRDLCKEVLSKVEMRDGKVPNGTIYSESGVQTIEEDGRVITNPEICEELLPTQEGFFFGGTGYDEWYIRDLEDTVEQLDRVLSDSDGSSYFEYQASW